VLCRAQAVALAILAIGCGSTDGGAPSRPSGSSAATGAGGQSGASVSGSGGAGGGGATGAAASGGSGGDGGLQGPIGEWLFHQVPGAICANGSPTGLGVNQGTGSSVVLFLSPGSACFDEDCSIGTPSMRKDGGFGAAELESCTAGDCDGGMTFPTESIWNRASPVNPFADATYIFVSNCAGDYYVGDNDHEFPTWTARFHGSHNQALFAAAVGTWFPDATRVVLTGGSAGSAGAILNYWQWVNALPSKRVDLISDSFAFVFEDGPQWRYELHNPQPPPGCDTCVDDYRTFYAFNSSLAPASRIAVLDSEDDWTLDATSLYKYTAGLEALQPELDGLANVRYHIANGNKHVLLKHPLDSDETDVVRPGEDPKLLSDFLGAMQGDDPAWTSESCLGP
jgi:hypothetical protein